MPKRRILEKFVMTEISAVDRPCQEHATVAIMKRASDGTTEADGCKIKELKAKVAKLHTDFEEIKKFWSIAARAAALAARRAKMKFKPKPETKQRVKTKLKQEFRRSGTKAIAAGAEGAVGYAAERAYSAYQERQKKAEEQKKSNDRFKFWSRADVKDGKTAA